MKIYLSRHGQNEDNAAGVLNGHRDLPLTDQGRAQAHEVAKLMKEATLAFDQVWTSPLVRASETADIISQTIDAPKPQVEQLLIERDFGVMTGVPQAKITEMCAPDTLQAESITYFLSPEGAETFPDLIARANQLLEKIENEARDTELILLVGHGDMGKMIYAAYYDLPWRRVLTDFHFGNSELLLLSHDSPADAAHVFTIEQHNS